MKISGTRTSIGRLADRRVSKAIFFPLLGWLLVALLFAGCGSEENPAETQTATEEAANTVATVTAAHPARTIQSIEAEVASSRGLPQKSEIAVSYLDRKELRAEMKSQMEKEYQPAEVAAQEKELKSLGLLEPADDLAADIEKMLGEEVAGYYDDETKQLKLVSDTQELNLINQVTLAHEVTHALQDQNFSLTTIIPDNSGNDDLDLARLALVEGDATLSEEDFTQANFSLVDMMSVLFGTLGASGGLGGNSYVEDNLMFPYTSGLNFVTALREKGGWEAVNAAYGKPPASTEQILHPGKYLAGEAPVAVRPADLAGAMGQDWQPVFENVLGEFTLVEMLSRDISTAKARSAAAGWGGDAIRYYEGPGGAGAMILETVWDSEADAAEFSAALGDALENRYSVKAAAAAGTRTLITPEGAWLIEQRGRSCHRRQRTRPAISR